MAAVKSWSGIVAIFFEIDFDPVIGFSFSFSEQEAVWTSSFLILGSQARNLAGALPLACRIEQTPHPERHEISPGRSTWGRTRGRASGGHPCWLLRGAHGATLSQRAPSELSHQLERQHSLCRLIKMLSEEKEINYSTAPFFVVLFWNAIDNSKVFAMPTPGPERPSFFSLLCKTSPSNTLALTQPVGLEGHATMFHPEQRLLWG